MTSDNLNIVLTNSLCCISAQAVKVSKLYSIGDTCADSELQKLKLMNDWFEALRCYKIDSIGSKFSYRVDYNKGNNKLSDVIITGYEYIVTVNGVEYTALSNNILTGEQILSSIFATITSISSYNFIVGSSDLLSQYITLYIEADCDVQSIEVKVKKILDGDIKSDEFLTMYQQGYCTPLNCLTETEFNSIIEKLMKECDICKCQLNQ